MPNNFARSERRDSVNRFNKLASSARSPTESHPNCVPNYATSQILIFSSSPFDSLNTLLLFFFGWPTENESFLSASSSPQFHREMRDDNKKHFFQSNSIIIIIFRALKWIKSQTWKWISIFDRGMPIWSPYVTARSANHFKLSYNFLTPFDQHLATFYWH